MPQPYTKVVPKHLRKGGIIDKPDELLENRQYQMALAMAVISASAEAEERLASILARLLGDAAQRAIDHYYSLNSETAKIAVIKAFAISKLDLAEFATLEAILKIYAEAQKLRNPIAHHTIRYSPDVPDGLLVRSPRFSLLRDADWSTVMDEMSVGIEYSGPHPTPDDLKAYRLRSAENTKRQESLWEKHFDGFNVYTSKELLAIKEKLRKVSMLIGKFSFYVAWRVRKLHPGSTPRIYQEIKTELETYQGQGLSPQPFATS